MGREVELGTRRSRPTADPGSGIRRHPRRPRPAPVARDRTGRTGWCSPSAGSGSCRRAPETRGRARCSRPAWCRCSSAFWLDGLNGGAVGQRIGEGHADLDDIGAALDQRVEQLRAHLERRVAGGDERHQRGPVLGPRRGRSLRQSGYEAAIRRRSQRHSECFSDRIQVLVAAAGEIDQKCARPPAARRPV